MFHFGIGFFLGLDCVLGLFDWVFDLALVGFSWFGSVWLPSIRSQDAEAAAMAKALRLGQTLDGARPLFWEDVWRRRVIMGFMCSIIQTKVCSCRFGLTKYDT